MVTEAHTKIANRCPACGHDTLFIGSGGWLTCSWLSCRNPGLDGALEAAAEAIIRASQLQHEVDEARREALVMRAERDSEISKRVILQAAAADILRGNAVELMDLVAPELLVTQTRRGRR